jgi:uncharacterized protein (DUF2062 family)
VRTVFKVNKKLRKRGRHTRKRQHLGHRWAEMLWPSMGLAALLRWAELRIKRSKGSTHYVAMGAAIGIFISFTPYLGTQVIAMFFLAYLFKASFVVAFIVSLIGNPWTFPFIFAWTYSLGQFLLYQEIHRIDPAYLIENFSFENMSILWNEYLWPMTVGGIPSGIVFGALMYVVIYVHIESYRKARAGFIKRQRERHTEKRELFKKGIERVKDIISRDEES